MQSQTERGFYFFLAVLAMISIISATGCGGSGGGGSNGSTNHSPTANAGTDQTVSENTAVQLNGTLSSDSDGTIQTYAWRQVSGPAAALTGAGTATPDFTAPYVSTDTELIFELTVTDNLGAQGKDNVSILVLENLQPVADAGADQQVAASQAATLNGGGSHDDDGSIAAYAWTQTGGTSVTGDPGFDAASPNPSFTAPASSEKLSFRLTVTDNLGSESSDDIDIYVSGVLFSDDFSQGLDAAWVKVDDSATASSWGITSNALQQYYYVAPVSSGSSFDESYHKGSYRYLSTTTGLTDYRFKVDVTPLTNGSSGGPDGNDVGIMFRYQDPNDYYRLSMNARYGFTRLEKKVGGQFSTLAVNAIGYFDDVPSEFIIDVKGNLIQVWIDNDPVFSVIDASLGSGAVALYCQDKIRFDNVLITEASLMPQVIVASPLAFTVATTVSSDLSVSANAANLPSGAWVEFLLNGSTSKTDLQAPFAAQFSGLAPGDYTVAAVLRDAIGNEITRDTNQTVGVGGGHYIAAGDSITNGSGDLFTGDNVSADSRIVAVQGYAAALDDHLTQDQGVPQIVFNEGVPGDTTADALGRINSILSRNARAESVLLLLGTNDVGSVNTSTYIANMQSLINSIDAAGMTARIALVPPQFNASTGQEDPTAKTIIGAYNTGLLNIVANNANALPGPDLYAFFTAKNGLFYDNLHPNSLGHACIAHLWTNAIAGTSDLPFILDNLQAPSQLYQQNLLETGNPYYIDRSYTLTSIPTQLSSAVWIMTANDDAANTSPSYLSFDLDRSATVYIAYDGRSGIVLPGWLSSFTDTGLQISTTAGSFDLYSRAYGSGTVTLPGNRANGGTGVLNYFIAVLD